MTQPFSTVLRKKCLPYPKRNKLESMNKIEKLNVLGYYPERLNVLLELADNSLNIQSFNILENMISEYPERYVPLEYYNVNFINCYNEEHYFNKDELYTFGVIGTNSKEALYNSFKQIIGMEDANFVNLINSTAFISNSAKLSHGIQIGIFAVVNALTEIGFGVNIKTRCYIGHHVKIGNYVTINPGSIISGLVEIGHNTLIGAGAIIRDGIKIGSNSIIGMGSNVVKDIPDNCIALGNPCKVLKYIG